MIVILLDCSDADAPQHDVQAKRFAAHDLPIKVGGEPTDDIYLDGIDTDQTVAFIGLLDEKVFVQPVDKHVRVKRNHQNVDASTWLVDGDTISINGRHIRFLERGDEKRLTLIGEAPYTDAAVEKQLVETNDEPVNPAGDAIAVPTRPKARRPFGLRSLVLLAVFCGLILVAAFVFFATPMSVTIDPAPQQLRISGVVPPIAIRDRYLALPGVYEVSARHSGYHPLTEVATVNRGEFAELHYQLRKLPGLLKVVTTPATDVDVYVDGELLGTTPMSLLELEAGPHEIRMQTDEFLDFEQTLEIEGLGREQTLVAALTPAWSAVSFTSIPQGATVSLNDTTLGQTPLTVDLVMGEYRVSVEKAGFQAATVEFTVEPDTPLSIPTLTLQEAFATLLLSSTPSGATVTVDGVFQGSTPVELSLRPKVAHEIRLARAGFAEVRRSLQLEPGVSEQLNVPLHSELGVVFINSTPGDAQLTVNGEPMGDANRRLTLPTIPHTVEVSRVGYETFRTQITPRRGGSQTIDVTLVKTSEAIRQPTKTSAQQTLLLVEPSNTLNGRLQLGAPRNDQGRRANENLHVVELTRSFFVSAKEVTNAEFRAFRPSHNSGTLSGVNLNADNQPVTNITWDDAARYLNWLSSQDNLPPAYVESDGRMVPIQPLTTGYRMPTEAEWVLIARYAQGAKANKYPWGAAYPPKGSAAANYGDQSAASLLPIVIPNYNDGFPASAPVGSFAPNAFGVYDLAGNVAEWCHDFYTVYPVGSGLSRDPQGPASGKHHVIRGSSWRQASIMQLRWTFRDYNSKARPDVGFRIARYVE